MNFIVFDRPRSCTICPTQFKAIDSDFRFNDRVFRFLNSNRNGGRLQGKISKRIHCANCHIQCAEFIWDGKYDTRVNRFPCNVPLNSIVIYIKSSYRIPTDFTPDGGRSSAVTPSTSGGGAVFPITKYPV